MAGYATRHDLSDGAAGTSSAELQQVHERVGMGSRHNRRGRCMHAAASRAIAAALWTPAVLPAAPQLNPRPSPPWPCWCPYLRASLTSAQPMESGSQRGSSSTMISRLAVIDCSVVEPCLWGCTCTGGPGRAEAAQPGMSRELEGRPADGGEGPHGGQPARQAGRSRCCGHSGLQCYS